MIFTNFTVNNKLFWKVVLHLSSSWRFDALTMKKLTMKNLQQDELSDVFLQPFGQGHNIFIIKRLRMKELKPEDHWS